MFISTTKIAVCEVVCDTDETIVMKGNEEVVIPQQKKISDLEVH